MFKRFYNFVRSAITDPSRDIADRSFVILTLISEVTVFIAFIGDIITGENIVELITLTATLIAVPIITFTCLYYNKVRLAIRLIIVGLLAVVLPILFFFGGGTSGGGVIWIIFAFIYVGLVIKGTGRKVVLSLIFLLAAACYLVEYLHPELVPQHDREMYYIDSFISLVMVGIVGFVMTFFQTKLFEGENKRAKEEARKAEELTRSQNRFFSSMSHEIRTPINSILGLNELILRDQSVSDEVAKDAAGIQGSGKMLLALINDILDFSKMEAGSMDIVPVDYPIGDLVSEIVNMIWVKASDKGLKFEVNIDPSVPTVLYGDEVRIKQVIVNLLNNAVKYTKDGSVGLLVECARRDEKENAADDDSVILRISVSDTGMGIKKEAMPFLFDAFKRVDEEKNRHIEGTGLGLSIVKQIVGLMEGEITVNSVYGEGSTFTVEVKQGVSDKTAIGGVSIHDQGTVRRDKYESAFVAPEASVLIVDDNEMNLEVERKLLTDTKMNVDTSLSGADALEKALKKRYDVILMDHLMPVMDGIECLDRMRNQIGGINRSTPVICLTANAGSENRELYKNSGFDGYLLKPVSGAALEEMLMRHIPAEKLIVKGKAERMREDIDASSGYSRKSDVLITSSSVCDLPDSIINSLRIPILPFVIRTDEGVFRDGYQMDADELVRYLRSGRKAVSLTPDLKAYTEFFSKALKRAHHLIYIAITSSMSDDYNMALEAAKSFDNVTVINSECLSSSTGLLVLIAYKLARQNLSPDEIVKELEAVKKRLKCSFIIDTTEYMAQKGLIRKNVHAIASALSLHPSIKISEDKYGIGGVWAGNTKTAYKRYIRNVFPVDVIPDSEIAFVTYVGLSEDKLNWIKEEIGRIAYFERIIFIKASAAISSNCGPGSFGILYFVKGNKSYNIGSLIKDEDELKREHEENIRIEQRAGNVIDAAEVPEEKTEAPREELKWYQKIDMIDGEAALNNSGSEDALKTVIRLFRDSVDSKYAELKGFYDAEDWENYTIKIHALKSSSKLIGAMDLSDRAQKLENAGKEGNIGYIKDNFDAFMADYVKLGKALSEPEKEEKAEEKKNVKQQADDEFIKSLFEELCAAAEGKDKDSVDELLKAADDYSYPKETEGMLADIRDLAALNDFDSVTEVLKGL